MNEQTERPMTDDQVERALTAWRAWAQFVFLGGGPVVDDDTTLQRKVCEQWEQEKRAMTPPKS